MVKQAPVLRSARRHLLGVIMPLAATIVVDFICRVVPISHTIGCRNRRRPFPNPGIMRIKVTNCLDGAGFAGEETAKKGHLRLWRIF